MVFDVSAADSETLTGFVGTNCGSTELVLVLHATSGELRARAQWMGDAQPFELTLVLRRVSVGSHSGALVIESAHDREGRFVPLPPSDGKIVLEYARVPPQAADVAGNDTM